MFTISTTNIHGTRNNQKVYNPIIFISELEALESKLDSINNQQAVGALEFIRNFIRAFMLCFRNSFEKQKGFNIHSLISIGNKLKEHTFASKKNTLRHEIHSLKKYLNKRNIIDNKMQEHTDILNIYWHSKADVEIFEKINACIEKFGSAIKTLQI